METNRFNGRIEKPAYTATGIEERTKEAYDKKNFNKPYKKNYNKKNNEQPVEKKPKPVPVYDAFQFEIVNDLIKQIYNFQVAQKNLDNMDYKLRRAAEKDLYCIGEYPYCPEEYPDAQLFMVERSLRINHETHKLMRASCAIIVLSKSTGLPAYYITSYLTDKGGSIAVTPITAEGPILYNTLRHNIDAEPNLVTVGPSIEPEETSSEDTVEAETMCEE